MCIALFTTAHPDYALILIDNRDEFILRPTSRPHWWTHPVSGKQVLSSRDLQRAEKGTWLGMTKSGSFAVLTNYRETNTHDVKHPVHGIKSRGGMVTAWLNGAEDDSLEDRVHHLVKDGGVQGVGGFSMICGKLKNKGGGIAIVSNRAANVDEVHMVAQERDETWGLSNTFFDAKVAWPKVELGTKLLKDVISKSSSATKPDQVQLIEDLFSVLDKDTLPAADPDTGFEEVIKQLRHSIYIPAIGDATHRQAMKQAVSKGRVPWAEDESELKAVEELLAEEQPDSDASKRAANGFDTGMYGTQRQTVMLVDWDGNVTVTERALWDRNGNSIPRGEGDVQFKFNIERWNE